jgi:hypothetical protein
MKYLRLRGHKELYDLLVGARCGISTSTSFSRKRWNALWTEIRFYIPVEKLQQVSDTTSESLAEICDKIMPVEAGLDVMKVEFAPLITQYGDEVNLVGSLEETSRSLSAEVIAQFLPQDVKDKGKEMAEVYLYLYCFENSLRMFIEKAAIEKLGAKYFSKLNLNKGLRENVARRREEENKKKWLRVRGDSDVFYLDFDDLGTLIQNNWDVFSEYFPDQNWIVTKIKEVADCRNLVAHNSYVESHEKDLIRVYYISILRQLDNVLRK